MYISGCIVRVFRFWSRSRRQNVAEKVFGFGEKMYVKAIHLISYWHMIFLSIYSKFLQTNIQSEFYFYQKSNSLEFHTWIIPKSSLRCCIAVYFCYQYDYDQSLLIKNLYGCMKVKRFCSPCISQFISSANEWCSCAL